MYKFTYVPNTKLKPDQKYKNELAIEYTDVKLKIAGKTYDMAKLADKKGDIMDLCDLIASELSADIFDMSFNFADKTLTITTDAAITEAFKVKIKGIDGKEKLKVKV